MQLLFPSGYKGRAGRITLDLLTGGNKKTDDGLQIIRQKFPALQRIGDFFLIRICDQRRKASTYDGKTVFPIQNRIFLKFAFCII